MTDADDALLVRPSARAQAPTLLGLGLAFVLYAVLGAIGALAAPIAVSGVLVFGGVVAVGGRQVVRARDAPWELRLDAAGVTVHGHRTVPWTDLAEVRVTGLLPRWFFWFSLGYRVVSFVPQPGVQLPALPSTSWRGRTEQRATRTRQRRYGSTLIVLPYAMNASAGDVTDSVRQWSTLPVR